MTQGINLWHTTAADNASAGTINWAEGMNPGSVNDSARQMMSDTRTWYEDYEWRDFGHSPTFASASSFTISSAASLSSDYCVNRRLRIVDSVSGTAYGTISATTWVGSTQTVTLSPLSTALNTTTAVALGISPTNSSVPASSLDGLTAFAVAQATLTTPGDMLYASATATAARIGIGAATSVLIGGSVPSWTAHPTLEGLSIGNTTSVTTAGAAYSQYGFYDADVRCWSPLRVLLGVTATSATTLTTTSNTIIDWHKAYVDEAGAYTATSQSRITIPSGFTRGIVFAQFCTPTNAAGGRQAQILKNGTGLTPKASSSVGSAGANLNTQVQVASSMLDIVAGDYFTLQCNQDSGTALTVTTDCYFGALLFK